MRLATRLLSLCTLAAVAACTASGPVNASPNLSITEPENDTEYRAGEPFSVVAAASDDGGVAGLSFDWEVSPDPEVDGHTFVSETEAELYFDAGLPEGEFDIAVVATDYAGETGTDDVHVVVEANDAPNVRIQQPIDGEIYELGSPIIVEVKVKAKDDDMSAITMVWGGIAEGVDEAPSTPPDDGIIIFYVEDVPDGKHELVVTGRDSGGAAETETVEFRVR